MKKTHRNIPVFIPQEGCPNNCVFCSQRKITGIDRAAELDTLREEVGHALSEKDWEETEIAFFGGSFTAIDRGRMVSLLSAAYEYVRRGQVSGIRISTRPDCIDEEILGILRSYGVTAIELGIQSISDDVLEKSGRGHTAADSAAACALIKRYGFRLGGQMMVGLPGSHPADERNTALAICRFGADEARIYPTVVFTGTKLYDMTVSGEYTPLTDEEAVVRSADCLEIFNNYGVKVLRIGLHASEQTVSAPFGATHPAIGELTESELYRRVIARLIGEQRGRTLTVFVAEGEQSKAAGQHRSNIRFFREIYGFSAVKIYGKSMPRMTAEIQTED